MTKVWMKFYLRNIHWIAAKKIASVSVGFPKREQESSHRDAYGSGKQ